MSSSVQGLSPVAQGSFSQTPFAHIVVYLNNKRMSGTLEVRGTLDTVTIYFRDGAPAKVRSSFEGKGLGQILFDLKLINEQQHKECQREMVERGGLQGEILIRRGFIDARTLLRGLREQLLLKIVDVFTMTDARYAFYDKVNLLMGYGADEVFPLDPYPVLLAATRVHGQRQRTAPVLAALDGRWISTPSLESLRRFRLNKAEREVCAELLGGAMSYDLLVKSGRYERQMLQHLLYVLLITKELKVEDEPPEVEAPARERRTSVFDSVAPATAAPESSLSPEATAYRKAVQQKAAAIASQNFFEMLGVKTDATVEDLRKAYFRLAKEFHPDRAASPERQDLRDILEYIFSNLAEANATLIDPELREGYEHTLAEGKKRASIIPRSNSGGGDPVRDAAAAENAFQKALVLMRRGQNEKAMELVQQARDVKPEEGEYLTVYVFLEAKLRPADAAVDDLIDRLRHVIEQNPRSERAHLFLGQLLKRIGHTAEAKTHFQKVVEVNSKNIEAAREVRIMDMRKRDDKSDKKGFLKKILG
ncbi:MAG: DnaJ domain-containing protein [Deltaproteobacteria bacterium]|nr:DnaJ domain-containing protein [Deltaproteobacteria bacterium]